MSITINFDEKTKNIVTFLANRAKAFGVRIFFVGGLVRDAIMGQKIYDIDIVVEGSAIDFVQTLGDVAEIKSTFEEYGTAKVQIEGLDIDFASTRREVYPFSGCLPIVVEIGVPIEEDLKRRDFTINAMAAEISNQDEYELIDLFDGQKDLKQGELKVLHPISYLDDPTRIIRGLDFELRFGFKFSQVDLEYIEKYLTHPNWVGISTNRIASVFEKLFKNEATRRRALAEIIEKNYYLIYAPKAFINIDKIMEAIQYFKLENVPKFIARAIMTGPFYVQEPTDYSDINRLFKDLTMEDIAIYHTRAKGDAAKVYVEKVKDIKPLINGAKLLELGFAEGAIIGEILSDIKEQRLVGNPEIITEQDEINYVLKNYTLA